MKPDEWDGFKVVISRQSHVTLRRPAGRSIAWFGTVNKSVDAVAQEALETYPGAVLVDKRVDAEAGRTEARGSAKSLVEKGDD